MQNIQHAASKNTKLPKSFHPEQLDIPDPPRKYTIHPPVHGIVGKNMASIASLISSSFIALPLTRLHPHYQPHQPKSRSHTGEKDPPHRRLYLSLCLLIPPPKLSLPLFFLDEQLQLLFRCLVSFVPL